MAGGFRPGQFGFDFFRVGEAVSDSLPALFEHFQNGFVGEFVEQAGDDEEADDLGNEVRPIDTKVAQIVANVCEKKEVVHIGCIR